jgi:prepilin peptidase CpaA
MPLSAEAMKILLLAPLTAVVIYFDVRYRRIPNVLVLAALVAGVTLNTSFGGMDGLVQSGYGFGMAFIPMLLMHVFGAMGAGDVKLFGAVGAVLGVSLVPITFVLVALLGGALAVYSMVRAGTVWSTLHGVLRIFVGVLPGWEMPRFVMAPDRRHTIPYGVAIMVGSLVAAVCFRA